MYNYRRRSCSFPLRFYLIYRNSFLVVLYALLPTSAVYYLHLVMYRTLYVRLQRCAALFGPQTYFPYPPTPTHAQCRPLITLFPRHNHCFRSGASRRLNCARYAVREENPGDAVAVAVSDFASGINHPRLYPSRRLTLTPTRLLSFPYTHQYIHTPSTPITTVASINPWPSRCHRSPRYISS